jgi:thiamine biosynthesis lipoprotein
MSEHELTFACMGTHVRMLGPDQARLEDARSWLIAFDARLSRFRPDSELCALNADPRPAVPASPLLRTAVSAGLWAAAQTRGLVDPTVLPALRRAGYVQSLAGVTAASLRAALAAAPPRRRARANPAGRWRTVKVDDGAGVVRRPPGVELDTGGTGKGLAADALAHRFAGRERFAIDCGGDMRVGGDDAERWPFEVEVAHPFTGEAVHRLLLGPGAIATSGIDSRLWQRPDGSFAHHLIDPATGEPSWTGLVSVTAIGPSALEAETLAKAALLSGPAAARELLCDHGGVLVHDDTEVELAGTLAHPRLMTA